MNLLISSSSDPYWNLATEEFLLKNSTENFIFLYINHPSVIVGKHQNAQKEINPRFVFDNKILVARRLSGGGAVYHDFGNLNFSFIQSTPPGENSSYKLLTQSIFGFLKHTNAEICMSERNDFMLNSKKISGSAMHVFKNRTLAHGTLLIDCNLYALSNALKGNPERFADKSIASKRSDVINLKNVDKGLSIGYILQRLIDYIKKENPITVYSIKESSLSSIQELVEKKYSTYNWIYGYSPKYSYQNKLIFNDKTVEYRLLIEKGIIESISYESENEIDESCKLRINKLKGRQHSIYTLNDWLNAPNSPIFDKLLFTSLF